jgi:ferric-dicitrate binding protein FerR (iron transport regulator)
VSELAEARMLDPNLFEATDWMIKLIFTEDEGSLRPDFTRWLDADPAHYTAFERVKWIWGCLERGRNFGSTHNGGDSAWHAPVLSFW